MRRALLAVASLLAVAGVVGPTAASAGNASTSFPHYDHVFLVIDENHNANQILGNPAAPEINALAADYGLATNYTGVADPSEPNYVAMLGGSTFGISSDDPYWFPGQTVDQPNLMSQLDAAGLTWKGYFQDLPYPGYRGYCFPAKCNGIPDQDTEYVAKHNGIVNFKDMQNPTDLAKMVPSQQLASDLASGSVPNFSYIVPDECNDMHGAPPWCVDSGKPGDVSDTWLVSQGDAYVGNTVNAITSSSTWKSGNDAIVVTFDEGNVKSDKVATVVVTNHGPRGVKDNTSYDHYSLLASLQQTFGLGCLQASCSATPMTPLFTPSGSTSVPTLPPRFTPPPNGTNTVSAMGSPVVGKASTLNCTAGWQQVPSPSIGNLDNDLASVSAASATDAWAVGEYYNANNPNVLVSMAEHWDGQKWSEYPLPNVGLNENSLFGVSELPTGHAWAVGYYVNAGYAQQTLVQHWDGSTWSVVPSPSPGSAQNILYGVAALSDSDVWAVGADQDANRVWHTLTEHWDGSSWTVVPSADPGAGGNQLYALTAVSSSSVYATGQSSGSSFPSQMLTEHWDGKSWSVLPSPADGTESLDPFGITGSDSALTAVGARESDTAPFTTLVASGAPQSLGLVSTPNAGAGEQNLFGAATAADGSVWTAGWYIDPSSGNHLTIVEHEVGGQWSIVPTPDPGTGDNGFASIAAVPGGGLWAVGVTADNGSYSTLVAFHC